MSSLLAVLGFLIKIDAQKDPTPAILLALAVSLLLWLGVSFAKRREQERGGSSRRSGGWNRGSQRPPRY